jgi:hypothetical protein
LGERKTTIPVSEETHNELYLLKRKLRLRSYDELVRVLLEAFRAGRRRVRRATRRPVAG